jgi:hypothetical protein
MTRFCPIRGSAAARKPFLFKRRLFGFANFSKFIFGRNGGNQCVAGEKIWNRRFLDLAGWFAAMAPRLGDYRKMSIA